jgi:PAS domain S-box-containing protein
MSPYGNLGLVTGRFCWMLVHDGPDAIIYTDIGRLIRFWNVSAERLFGYSAREAIGRPLDFVIPETCRERYSETDVEASPANGLCLNSELVSAPVRRKGGKRILIEFAMYRDLECDRTVVGLAVIARDLTKRIRNRLESPTSESTLAGHPGELRRY